MNEADSLADLIMEAKKLREKNMTTCPEIENYLNYQWSKLLSMKRSNWSYLPCTRPRTEVRKQFKRAFKTLTKLEQAEFYLMNVTNVKSILDGDNQKWTSAPSWKKPNNHQK